MELVTYRVSDLRSLLIKSLNKVLIHDIDEFLTEGTSSREVISRLKSSEMCPGCVRAATLYVLLEAGYVPYFYDCFVIKGGELSPLGRTIVASMQRSLGAHKVTFQTSYITDLFTGSC